MKVVDVAALVRRYGYAPVLRRLDLEVPSGEHVVITGDNGSGKTTLLRVLAGLLRPTSGEVVVCGGNPSSPGVRKRVGLIGHSPSLYPRMTAHENIVFWSRMYDAPGGVERGRELLARVGLDPGDRRHVGTYSQGMRQRASVARALCTDPELVLADEPLAGLDGDAASAVASLLRAASTVVAVSHDPDKLGATRRLVLHAGRLDEAGAHPGRGPQ